MPESDLFILDTNLLVYYFDSKDKTKHSIAKKLIDSCWEKQTSLAISSQNLSEFFFVTTTKSLLSKQEARNVVSDIIEFTNWIKMDFSYFTVLEAAKICEENSMHYWDSLLAATMKQNGIFSIYTENTKDFKPKWLNAVNPFIKNSVKKIN